jgi:hypothetical protein
MRINLMKLWMFGVKTKKGGVMKKIIVLAVLAMVMLAGLAWAGEKETLQQKLGANVEQGQKLALRQQEIQAELGKIPKVAELITELNKIQESVNKLQQENQEILGKLNKPEVKK